MTDQIDFKKYWKKQTIETPDISEVIKKANQYKRKVFLKLVAANITLITTCILIGFIWYYFQPEFLTTKVGIVLCIIDMAVYLVFQNTLIPYLKKNPELNIKDQLRNLLKLGERQYFQQTTLLNVYFIILYLGLSLYLYEYVSRMNLISAVVVYAIVFFWIALSAFYFRPKIVKKHRTQLHKLTSQLKKLKEQIDE